MRLPLKAASAPNQKQIFQFALFNIALLAMLSIWLWQQNQPNPVIEPQLPDNGKMQCVSYSPYYHAGQTPLNPNTFIQPTQIDSDLAHLAKQFSCVRIYSVGQGLDYVPQAAAKLGMKVYLGAWIGWVKALNEKELDLAIAVANQHPDTVKALIVGNEVLLRGEQPEAAMKAYLTKAKQNTQVPVTYADVWEFWRKHPSLESDVDFITVHILPYWEDDPQPIAHALAHTDKVMSLLNHTFKKPILIGETGWPSIGRQRQGSQPSNLNQAAFLRGFLQLAHEKNWNYNLIEAIDQPWKRNLEGTVGGYWGIYNTDLTAKFPLNGPVAERTDKMLPLIAASIGALLFLCLSIVLNERRTSALLGLTSLGALFGIILMLQSEYLIASCRDIQEWLALGGIATIGNIAIIGTIWTACKPSVTNTRLLQTCLTLILLSAISASALLILDGRYRDFSINLYALPAIQLSLGLLLLNHHIRPEFKIFYLLNIVAVSSAAYCLYLELSNALAATWLMISIMIAVGTWPQHRSPTHQSP